MTPAGDDGTGGAGPGPRPAFERPLAWVLWILLGAAVAAVLHGLRSALVPFLIAFVIAYVFAPWVGLLERRARLPRPLGTAVVFAAVVALFVLLALGLFPVIETQVLGLVRWLPGALDRLQQVGLPLLSDYLSQAGVPAPGGDWIATLKDAVATFGPTLFKSGRAALLWAASSTFDAVVWALSAAIVPVLVFYLLMDFPRVGAWLRARMPRGARGPFEARLGRIDTMLGQYLRGQLTVAVILSALYAVGLTLAGVEAGVAIGVVAGLGNMVPYLGFVVGITLSLLVTTLSHFDLVHPLYVVAVFAVVQGLEATLISPRIVGERVGIHPIAIILSLFVGGEAFGFLGVLLGVPAAIAVKVALEPGDGGDPSPSEGDAAGPR